MSADFASAPGLYVGVVTHHRLRPREHRLSYRIYSLLLDIDRLEALDKKLHLFSLNKFNLFSFAPRDRGDGSGRSLRAQVEAAMMVAGVKPDGGAIRLLTMPRLLGWAFNPLSVFYCHRRDGSLAAVLWEVDNTFGERHAYMIPVAGDGLGDIDQRCAKDFFVSPFMNMQLEYHFRLRAPDDLLRLTIDVHDPSGRLLTARYLAHRRELTDGQLLRVFFSIPLLSLRVVGGILWEALKLWRKGIGLRSKPPPPDALTAIRLPEATASIPAAQNSDKGFSA